MTIPPTRRGPASSARRALACVAAIAVMLDALMLGFTAFSLQESRRGHEERAATAARNLSALLERDLQSTLQKVDLALLAVVDEGQRAPRHEGANASTFQAFLRRQESRLLEVRWLGTTDALGRVERRPAQSQPPASPQDREFFHRLADRLQNGVGASHALAGRIAGLPVLVFARGLTTPEGGFDGIVFAAFEVRHFEHQFAALEVGPQGLVLLRDEQLEVIARHPSATAPGQAPALGRSDQVRAMVEAGRDSGSFTGTGVDGITRQVSFQKVGSYPLYSGVGLASVDYLVDWQVDLRKAVVFDLAFVLATAAIALLAGSAWRRRELNLLALSRQERRFRTLVESSPDALVIADAEGRIAIVNRQAEAMFEYPADELLGQPLAMLLLGHVDRAPQRLEDRWAITRAGREFPVSVSLSPIETEEGGMTAAAIRDVTERRASEERIAFLAHHDALTGLPNRIVMQTRFAQAAALADRDGTRLALLFLDLDNFKTVNDSLGHQVGDALLRSVAERLRDCTRDIDTISRQGGDEFLLLFAHLPDGETARLMVERLVQRFQQASVVDGRPIATPFSIGVALYPDDGRDFVTCRSTPTSPCTRPRRPVATSTASSVNA